MGTLESMQLVEEMFSGKQLTPSEVNAASKFLVESYSDPLIQQEISDIIIASQRSASYSHLQEIIYFTRFIATTNNALFKAESGLQKLKEQALPEDDKISLEEYALINDVAKLFSTLHQLPSSIRENNQSLAALYQQVERCHQVVTVCKGFTLDSTPSNMTMFLPYQGKEKATTADWMMALMAKFVRVAPLEPPRSEQMPTSG